MTQMISASAHYFLRALIMLGFTVYIAFLIKTQSLDYYIAPRMFVYVKIAAVGLGITAIFQVYLAVRSLQRHSVVCGCEHEPSQSRSLSKNVALYGLFVFPLVLGFLLPNTALSGSLVPQKGINVGGPPLTGSADRPESSAAMDDNADPELKALFKTDKYNRDYAKLGMMLYKQGLIELNNELFLEKWQALNTFVGVFQGKELKITGFIYRDPGMPASQFIVGRMAITCCTADASPYGVIAESAEADRFANDDWVTVTGTIGKTNYKGRDVMKINVMRIEKTAPPSKPYVYPDYHFVSQL